VTRRYLALFFPWLPIERLRLRQPHKLAAHPGAPVAFVESVKGAMRLTARCQTAAALGLAPAMTLADARAQVPDLLVIDHAPHADHDWLEALAEGCGRYTPSVALDPPEGLVLDIAGCTHPFGGERELGAEIEARLARRGILVRWACGETPDAARALSRFQTAAAPGEDEAIRRLPVAALELDAEATTSLSRAGLKTVGDIACRPLAMIAARFGAEAVTKIRRILGEEESPLVPRIVSPPVRVERRFSEPVARTE
jgi:protein ImuB